MYTAYKVPTKPIIITSISIDGMLMEEMLPQAAPTVTYVDIPTDECRQMCPITPPQSPINPTDVRREDAAADEEVEEMLPQVTPTVT